MTLGLGWLLSLTAAAGEAAVCAAPDAVHLTVNGLPAAESQTVANDVAREAALLDMHLVTQNDHAAIIMVVDAAPSTAAIVVDNRCTGAQTRREFLLSSGRARAMTVTSIAAELLRASWSEADRPRPAPAPPPQPELPPPTPPPAPPPRLMLGGHVTAATSTGGLSWLRAGALATYEWRPRLSLRVSASVGA